MFMTGVLCTVYGAQVYFVNVTISWNKNFKKFVYFGNIWQNESDVYSQIIKF